MPRRKLQLKYRKKKSYWFQQVIIHKYRPWVTIDWASDCSRGNYRVLWNNRSVSKSIRILKIRALLRTRKIKRYHGGGRKKEIRAFKHTVQKRSFLFFVAVAQGREKEEKKKVTAISSSSSWCMLASMMSRREEGAIVFLPAACRNEVRPELRDIATDRIIPGGGVAAVSFSLIVMQERCSSRHRM